MGLGRDCARRPADASRHGGASLRAWYPPRRRCRSHRSHRQCRPQVDAGGQAAHRRRPVLLARTFAGRRACRRRHRSNRVRAAGPFTCFQVCRQRDRHHGFGDFSAGNRDHQCCCFARCLGEFPPRPPRRAGRRARTEHAPLRARSACAYFPAAVPHDFAELADVPGRVFVRARLRYRDRNQPVRGRRQPGVRRRKLWHGDDFSRRCSPPA